MSIAKIAMIALVMAIVAIPGIRLLNPSHAATTGYITRSGMNLSLNGSPYKFAGMNYAAMVSGSCGFTASAAQRDAYFAALPPRSMTRIWLINGTVSLTSIDQVVASAAAHDQYIDFTLADQGGGCDPMPKATGFYTGGYKGAYFTWVNQVVPRYKASTAVGMWEVINEGNGSAVQFYTDTAALIKSLDPNHLVSTGAAGFDNSANFANIHASPNIDLVSAHEYDNGPSESYWAGVCKTTATKLGKPCYIGEFGYYASPTGNPASHLGNFTCENFTTRATWIKQKNIAYLADSQIAGTMLWNADSRSLTDCQISFSAGDPIYASLRSITGYPNGAMGGTTPSPTPAPTPAPTPKPSPSPTPAPAPTPTPSPPLPPVGTGSVNDTSFVYSGTWLTSATNAAEFQGNDHYSRTAGSTYALTFVGTQAKLYSSKAPQHGIAAIKIDNGAETLVDLYAVARADQQLVFVSPTLASVGHTITVRVTATKNAAALDVVVNADRIDVVAGTVNSIPGDANNDTRVNALDLSMLISHDGQNYPPADFNGDGTVGSADMAVLLGHWTW